MSKPIGSYDHQRQAFEAKLSKVFDDEQAAGIKALIDTHPDAIVPLLTAIAKVRKGAYDEVSVVQNAYRTRELWEEAHAAFQHYANVLRLKDMWEACQRAREGAAAN